MNKLFPAAIAAAFALSASAAVSGLDLGSSSRIAGSAQQASPNYQPAHQGHDHIRATGTVNSVDLAGHKVNLSHGPISQIGWPAMTMDFAVAPGVDLKGFVPGTPVEFTLEKGTDGMFQVESLTPVRGGK